MLDYTVKVNNVDITDDIERDSYFTRRIPVYSERITTLDGVDHVGLRRTKGEVSFDLNPKTDARTKIICEALLATPCSVIYQDLQLNNSITATMTIDDTTAQYLSRCLARGDKWNQIESITLTEL